MPVEINRNVETIIAIEYLLGAQALEFRKFEPSRATMEIYNKIRSRVKPLERDRPSTGDIDAICSMMETEDFRNFIMEKTGFN